MPIFFNSLYMQRRDWCLCQRWLLFRSLHSTWKSSFVLDIIGISHIKNEGDLKQTGFQWVFLIYFVELPWIELPKNSQTLFKKPTTIQYPLYNFSRIFKKCSLNTSLIWSKDTHIGPLNLALGVKFPALIHRLISWVELAKIMY